MLLKVNEVLVLKADADINYRLLIIKKCKTSNQKLLAENSLSQKKQLH